MKTKLLFILLLFPLYSHSAPRYQLLLNLAKKQVTTESQGTAYDRIRDFGHWVKPTDACLNTRNYILANSSTVPIKMSSTQYCSVKSGKWKGQYSHQLLTTSREAHIDHMVPLKEAYASGAYQWSPAHRCHYNNYLSYQHHLKLVSATENLKKGSSEPIDYTPPLFSEKCSYLKQWIVVKLIWRLTFDPEELNSFQLLGEDYSCSLDRVKIDMRFLNSQRQFTYQHIKTCL